MATNRSEVINTNRHVAGFSNILSKRSICLLLSIVILLTTSLSVESLPHEGLKHHFHEELNHTSEDHLTVEATRFFLRRLFEKYGEQPTSVDQPHTSSFTTSMTMTFEGFEHLLESLGLGDVMIADHSIDDHRHTPEGDNIRKFKRMHEQDEFGQHRHGRRHATQEINVAALPETVAATGRVKRSVEVGAVKSTNGSRARRQGIHSKQRTSRRSEGRAQKEFSQGPIVVQKVNYKNYNW